MPRLSRSAGSAVIAVLLATATTAAGTPALHAQGDDTTRAAPKPLLTKGDALLAGAFAVATAALMPYDRQIDETIRDTTAAWFPRYKRQAVRLRPLQETTWLLISLGAYGTGRLTHGERLADLGLHMVEANLIATAIGHTTKSFVGRIRPRARNSDPGDFRFLKGFTDVDYRSFPGMHMVGNFAAASVITAETHRWWPRSTWVVAPLAYGGAAYLGVLRLIDGAHWASDNVAGAAIGTLTGLAIVRYAHAHPGNRVDRWLLGAAPAPDGGVTLSARMGF